MNDPNGLVYAEGVYHLFYQNNPWGSDWGNLSWGHATSRDLTNWEPLPVAIECDEQEWIFSGSVVHDVRNSSGLAPAGRSPLVAVFTSCLIDPDPARARQRQSLAFSVDEGVTWVKYAGNPVLDAGLDHFRDPKVFWFGGDDGHWVMVVVEAEACTVAVYASDDLIAWTLQSRFGPANSAQGAWECPDLFPLTVVGSGEQKWVLVVSVYPGGIAAGSGVQYFVGDFDGARFTPDRLSASEDSTSFDWVDYGRDFYAPATFADAPDERRIMMGWANNWDYARDSPLRPWRSAMTLPRELSLVADEEGLVTLRSAPVVTGGESFDTDVTVSLPVSASRASVLIVSAEPGGAGDRLEVVVDGAGRTVSVDRSHSGDTSCYVDFGAPAWAPLPPGEVCDIRVIIDGCVAEIFVAGGRVTFTMQVFPQAPLRFVATAL